MCSPAVGFPNWVDENWHLSVALICMRLVMSEFECLHVSESTVNSLSPQDQSVSVVPTCFLVGSSGDLFLKHYLIQSSQFPCTVVFETSILQIRKGRFREFRLLVWGTQLIRYRVGILIYLYLTWKYPFLYVTLTLRINPYLMSASHSRTPGPQLGSLCLNASGDRNQAACPTFYFSFFLSIWKNFT